MEILLAAESWGDGIPISMSGCTPTPCVFAHKSDISLAVIPSVHPCDDVRIDIEYSEQLSSSYAHKT